jgi:DNA-binding NtrC family response regulator
MASEDGPVIVEGEPGVGKALLARAIHTASARGGGAFVEVDLTQFEQSDMLAELFGPQGAFQRADGGTLLIEGIDEAPLSVQGPLVSAIEEGTLDNPLTGDFGRIDVRLIFATGTPLAHAVEEGYVLEALADLVSEPIVLAPLRHRVEDIAPLFIHFLTQELRTLGNETVLQQGTLGKPLWISPDFLGRLTSYYWPGNVDQVQALAEAVASNSHEGLTMRITEPVAALLSNATAYVNDLGLSAPSAGRRDPNDVDEMDMVGALRAYRWCATATAKHLGISRRALFELMDRSSAIRPSSGLKEAAVRGQYDRVGGNLALLCEQLEVSRRTLKRQLYAWDRLTAPDVPFDLMGI